jgi:hypothetical protein
MRRLKLYLPGYEKGSGNIFAITALHLAVAIQRAEALAQHFNAHTEPEPFTAIGELVNLLIKLRD